MSTQKEVLLCEVGPRDGFQYEERLIPTDLKVEIIRGLVSAGLQRLQIASFVHPRWVPQMADAEKIVEKLGPAPDATIYAGLALNTRGVERAAAAGLSHVDLSIATHDQHSRDNANMSVDEAVREAERMIKLAKDRGLHVQMGLQTVFGYERPGDTSLDFVAAKCEQFSAWGVDEISLADTTGMANPVLIRTGLRRLLPVVDVPIILHLHDTRGLGLVNVVTALDEGIRRFDTSFGGLGGCPFIRGASGNIATEDTAYLLHSLGFSTGVDIDPIAAVSRHMEHFLEHQLPGKMQRVIRAPYDS